MEVDLETLTELRAILQRDCVVEITLAFIDESEEASTLESVDVGTSVALDGASTPEEKQRELEAMLDSAMELLRRAAGYQAP